MSDYRHNGIEISFDTPSAKFEAVIDGKRVRAVSLDAIKKQIDKRKSFDEFAALAAERYGRGMREVKVVGVRKPRGRHQSSHWVFEKGGADWRVLRDTPETRALVAAYDETAEKNNAAIDGLKEEISDAWDRLGWIKPVTA